MLGSVVDLLKTVNFTSDSRLALRVRLSVYEKMNRRDSSGLSVYEIKGDDPNNRASRSTAAPKNREHTLNISRNTCLWAAELVILHPRRFKHLWAATPGTNAILHVTC
jgi:hypothetical protein